jgi:hypothetical protein
LTGNTQMVQDDILKIDEVSIPRDFEIYTRSLCNLCEQQVEIRVTHQKMGDYF